MPIETVTQHSRSHTRQHSSDNYPHTSPCSIELLRRYVGFAVKQATITQHPDGYWFANIPSFQGVWAKEASAQDTRDVLDDVLFDWLLFKLQDGDRDFPVIENIDLNLL